MADNPPRILVIDDEPAICLSMQMYLEDMGFAVQTAQSGEAALQAVTNGDFDLAIVDLRLGDRAGDDLIQELHQVRPQLRFMIFTGSLDFAMTPALQAIGLSLDDIVTKPVFDLVKLEEAIQRILIPRGAEGHD